MNGPSLHKEISIDDFDRGYWLKRELIEFCRTYKLPTSGSKSELTQRIRRFLQSGEILKPLPRQSRNGRMPETFRRDSVIGSGWRCSQQLRAFFEVEIGAHFHFDATMRDFIKHGEGKTLQEAIDAWHQAQHAPKIETEIAPQFEYNRHIREYFKHHPGATLQDAIAAWKQEKARRSELK
jgi:hypothetical protein